MGGSSLQFLLTLILLLLCVKPTIGNNFTLFLSTTCRGGYPSPMTIVD